MKEGNVLFNDALNTFFKFTVIWRQTIQIARGNPLPPHGLHFSINSKDFYMHHSRQDNTYHSLCYTSNSLMSPLHERNVLFNEHSTHFIYGYMASDIWLRIILIEKGNQLPPDRLLLSINSKGSFICTIPQPCYNSRGALAGTRNSSMGPPHKGSIRQPIAP